VSSSARNTGVWRQRLWNKLSWLRKGGFLAHRSNRRERRWDRNRRRERRVLRVRSRTFAGQRAGNILPKKKSAMCWMDCVERRASLSCAAVKASPRASITNGRRYFLGLASVGLPVIRLGQPPRERWQPSAVKRRN